MGRKPRHQHERCKLPDAKRTGANLAWLVVVLVTAWQTASPTLCPGPTPTMVDAGTPELPPVPETVWADSGIGGGVGSGALLPDPQPGQLRPPCPSVSKEINGGCWRQSSGPPCASTEVSWQDACWYPLPKPRPGPPVSGGG